MLARLKRFSFISIPNDRQFVKRVSEKILMDLAILRGICSLQAEKTFFHGILWEEQLGGASADAQSYWQGRFAVCAFVGDFLGIGRTRNSWGGALNPTRDRRKGTKSPPLTPPRLSWSRFHAPSACSFLVLRRSLCLLPKLSVKNQKSPRIVRDSGGDNAYRSPLRPRLRLTRRTGCPAFFFAPDAFVRATGLLAGALSTRTGVPPRRILPSLPMTTG